MDFYPQLFRTTLIALAVAAVKKKKKVSFYPMGNLIAFSFLFCPLAATAWMDGWRCKQFKSPQYVKRSV